MPIDGRQSITSPMLPPPSHPAALAVGVSPPPTGSGRLANARASSVMLPIDDLAQRQSVEIDDDDGDYRELISAWARTPAERSYFGSLRDQPVVKNINDPQSSSSAAPSSWKPGQIVIPPRGAEFGHRLPVLEQGSPQSSVASRSATAATYASAQAQREDLDRASLHTRTTRSSSPSPFDNVVFDLGKLKRTGTQKTSASKAKKGKAVVRTSGERAEWPSDAGLDDEEAEESEERLPSYKSPSPPRSAQEELARASREPSPTNPPHSARSDASSSQLMSGVTAVSDDNGAFVRRMLAGWSTLPPQSSHLPTATAERAGGAPTQIASYPEVRVPPAALQRAPSLSSQRASSEESSSSSSRRRTRQGNWV
jgi:hypothetical protein